MTNRVSQGAQTATVERVRSLVWIVLKFGVVGLGSITVYFAILLLLRPLIENLLILTSLSYVLSALFNYAAQRWFTFNSSTPRRGAWLRYIIQHAICMALNSGLMMLLVDQGGFALIPAQVIVTTIVAGSSFVLSYLWVYR